MIAISGLPSQISTNTDSMASDINTLQELLFGAREQLKKMMEEIRILDSSWEGPANEMFIAESNKDYASSEDLFQTVEKILECMDYARNEYIRCEGSVSDIISGIGL